MPPSGPVLDYNDYLMMLQQKNRLMKKMRAKGPQQLEMERREQGFSLYLNGENAKGRKKEGGPLKALSQDAVLPSSGKGRDKQTCKTTGWLQTHAYVRMCMSK